MNKKLTREEILKMLPSRQMDALIGMRIFDHRVFMTFKEWEHAGRPLYNKSGIKDVFVADIGGNLPKYSSYIEAAWEVIEAMCKKHFRYEVGGNFMGLGHKYAAFDNEQWADNNPPSKAFAETAPLAICRAALLAVMEAE